MGKCFSSCTAVVVSGTVGLTNEFGSLFEKKKKILALPNIEDLL